MGSIVGACVRLLVILWVLTATALAGPLARVKVALASVTAAPDPKSEIVTEVLLWDSVEVVERKGEWASVLVPEQYRTESGYPGWMPVEALDLTPERPTGTILSVRYAEVFLRENPDPEAPEVSKAYMGTRLPVIASKWVVSPGQGRPGGEKWLQVRLPDSRAAWVRASQLQNERAPSLEEGLQVVDLVVRLGGTPYLWGGMSKVGIDCSGLVYVVYRLRGVTLPRDADQQFQVGEAVGRDELLPGDLVFFGEKKGEITHVGIYAGGGTLVQSTDSSGVNRTDLDQGWYKEYYQGARRVLNANAGGKRVLTPAPSP